MSYQAHKLPEPREIITLGNAIRILEKVQEILWLEDNGVNPEKEWDSDTVDEINEVFQVYGLGPQAK